MRVAVARGPQFLAEANCHALGRVVGTSFDEQGLLWAWVETDVSAPVRALYGLGEEGYGAWPQERDELVATAQSWHLIPSMGGFRLEAGLSVFVYAREVEQPGPTAAKGGSDA